MNPPKKSERVPKKMKAKFDEITKITDQVCKAHLNDEYAQMARYTTAAMARKRPSPLLKGQAKSWACGVVYALGFVNFLSDPSFEPYMKMSELCEKFGVSKSTGYNKSRVVRDALDLHQMNPDWTLPSLMEINPFVQLEEMVAEIFSDDTIPEEFLEMLALAAFQRDELLPEALELPAELRELLAIGQPVIDVPAPKRRNTRSKGPRCGICGKQGKLTKTPCCAQWVCDDEDEYVMFSYAQNSCFRNHDRYTLCSYHSNEEHSGDWTECKACRDDFETEMYVWYGTNEWNFVTLENPPDYEPTRCSKCNAVIVLAEGGYSRQGDNYLCGECTGVELLAR